MARIKMVTRTIELTHVTFTGLNVTTNEVLSYEADLNGKLDAQLSLKQVKELYETDEFKPVIVNTVKHTEKLFGMPELEFIKYAQELDPETRKTI